MKKHRLQVDTLAVESFPVAPAMDVLRGTVHAAEAMATQAYGCTRGDSCRTSCGVIGDCTCPPPP